MGTTRLLNTTITNDVVMTDYLGGGGSGMELADFAVSIATNVAGAGNLLCTLQYFDGQATQQLNVSLNLTAANAIEQIWPDLWHDNTQPVSIQWTYLGGIVDGTADVQLEYRN